MKRGIVAPDLIEERAKCDFDQDELREFLAGGADSLAVQKETYDMFGSDPELRNYLAFNDLSQEEKKISLLKLIRTLKLKYERFLPEIRLMDRPIKDFFSYPQGQVPGSMSLTMFRLSFENLANEE